MRAGAGSTVGENALAPRLGYLEGLRGIAALQVVLLHFVTAFRPSWPDRAGILGFVFDGHSAVYIFFLISGAVLSRAFAREGAGVARRIAQRVVRIGIPVAAACVFAALLLAAMPAAHGIAARLGGSPWFAMDSSGPATLAQVLRETAEEAMVTGYADTTLLPARLVAWLGLDPLADSLDAPFWSLHMEMAGMLLVLALVRLRAAPRWHAAAILLCALGFGGQAVFLFVLGHLAARRLGTKRSEAGLALLALGIAMCAAKDWRWVDGIRAALAHLMLLPMPGLYQFQSQCGAVLVFAGIALSPLALRALSIRPARWLGRLSFGLYLVHFPILFTVVATAWSAMAGRLPGGLALALAFALLLALSLLAAAAFARFVDRPAIALGRRIARPARRPVQDAIG